MSPEVIKEQGHNEMADWWSFGITLYEMATGTPPFSIGNGTDHDLEELAEKIKFEDLPTKDFFSDDFQRLIDGLTHKNPLRRLGSRKKGGIKSIKKEPFFKGVNWDDVLEKKLKPPYNPSIQKNVKNNKTGEIDPLAMVTHNFDLKHLVVDVDDSLIFKHNLP